MEDRISSERRQVWIPVGSTLLDGDLVLPANPSGIVVFAHGSGSSRLSPRNRFVAGVLHEGGLGTLLLDLLTEEEEDRDLRTREHRFDIDLLSSRVTHTLDWLARQADTAHLRIGLFGSSTGAAAALVAAATRPTAVGAVVSRGGRPDLAGDALPRVCAPTLLIVGGDDEPVLGMNRTALTRLSCTKQLVIIPGATHLFEEPGALARVAGIARDWFREYLATSDIGG